MEFKEQKVNGFGLIQKQEDGSIVQIGLTGEQYILFEIFLAKISKDKPLMKLPRQFDLIHKINPLFKKATEMLELHQSELKTLLDLQQTMHDREVSKSIIQEIEIIIYHKERLIRQAQ